MSDLHVVATMVSREGKADALRDALLPATQAFREEEGCLSYALLEDQTRPGRFMTFEHWRDRAALDVHMQSPAMKALAPRIPELLGEALKQDFLDARLVL
ncbi:putative quinol monooxygenase [soil metagenome]